MRLAAAHFALLFGAIAFSCATAEENAGPTGAGLGARAGKDGGIQDGSSGASGDGSGGSGGADGAAGVIGQGGVLARGNGERRGSTVKAAARQFAGTSGAAIRSRYGRSRPPVEAAMCSGAKCGSGGSVRRGERPARRKRRIGRKPGRAHNRTGWQRWNRSDVYRSSRKICGGFGAIHTQRMPTSMNAMRATIPANSSGGCP